jgi:hypothetical protein
VHVHPDTPKAALSFVTVCPKNLYQSLQDLEGDVHEVVVSIKSGAAMDGINSFASACGNAKHANLRLLAPRFKGSKNWKNADGKTRDNPDFPINPGPRHSFHKALFQTLILA